MKAGTSKEQAAAAGRLGLLGLDVEPERCDPAALLLTAREALRLARLLLAEEEGGAAEAQAQALRAAEGCCLTAGSYFPAPVFGSGGAWASAEEEAFSREPKAADPSALLLEAHGLLTAACGAEEEQGEAEPEAEGWFASLAESSSRHARYLAASEALLSLKRERDARLAEREAFYAERDGGAS